MVSTQTFLPNILTISLMQEPDFITIVPFFILVLKKSGESVAKTAKVKINDLAHKP